MFRSFNINSIISGHSPSPASQNKISWPLLLHNRVSHWPKFKLTPNKIVLQRIVWSGDGICIHGGQDNNYRVVWYQVSASIYSSMLTLCFQTRPGLWDCPGRSGAGSVCHSPPGWDADGEMGPGEHIPSSERGDRLRPRYFKMPSRFNSHLWENFQFQCLGLCILFQKQIYRLRKKWMAICQLYLKILRWSAS